MRLRFGATAFLLFILCFFTVSAAQAQAVTEGPDSVRVPVPDTLYAGKTFFFSDWDKPAKAALFSAVVPGLGQIYNKAYWKVPIVWATGAVMGYFLIDNNRNYQNFREALITRNSGGEDQFANHPTLGVNYTYGTQNLKYARDQYRRWRDMTILLSIAAWGLNVAEAYVHAHIREFDINDDLTLRVQPSVIDTRYTTGNITPGITLTLYTNKVK